MQYFSHKYMYLSKREYFPPLLTISFGDRKDKVGSMNIVLQRDA